MRKNLIILTCLLALGMTACMKQADTLNSNTPEQETTTITHGGFQAQEVNPPQTTPFSKAEDDHTAENIEESTIGKAESNSLSVDRQFSEILAGTGSFYTYDYEELVTLSQYCAHFEDSTDTRAIFSDYAIIDLDGDDVPEMVLKLMVNDAVEYGFVILHQSNGEIYSYTKEYRTFMDLKQDGSFSYSSGASESGFGTLTFEDNGNTRILPIGNTEQTETGDIDYTLHGNTVNENDYLSAEDEQLSKPEISWTTLH